MMATTTDPDPVYAAAAGDDLTESPMRIQEEAPTMQAAKALLDKQLDVAEKRRRQQRTL